MDEDDNGAGDGAADDGYVSFRGRQASGVLYRINPMPDELIAKMEEYVHGGPMGQDMRYARAVFGLVNTSGRKDFELFWESPWNEEHVQDAPRKRKLETQQRSMAVRSYIRASSMQDPDNVGKFLETVDQLTQWEDRHDAKENIKTVSRLVQSFERTAIRSLAALVGSGMYKIYADSVHRAIGIGDDASALARGAVRDDPDDDDALGAVVSLGSSLIEKTACSMRRHNEFFDLFAAAVASEIVWADATNGTRSMPNHLCQRLSDKKLEALVNLARTISSANPVFNRDIVGMPLMEMTGSMCVTRGVLVVCPGSLSSTYVLDIEPPRGAAPGAPLDLSNVRTITVTQIMEDEIFKPARGAARR